MSRLDSVPVAPMVDTGSKATWINSVEMQANGDIKATARVVTIARNLRGIIR